MLTGLLVGRAVGTVLGVNEDAALLHELGLFSIVGGQVNGRQLILRRLGQNGGGGHGEMKKRATNGNGASRP